MRSQARDACASNPLSACSASVESRLRKLSLDRRSNQSGFAARLCRSPVLLASQARLVVPHPGSGLHPSPVPHLLSSASCTRPRSSRKLDELVLVHESSSRGGVQGRGEAPPRWPPGHRAKRVSLEAHRKPRVACDCEIGSRRGAVRSLEAYRFPI